MAQNIYDDPEFFAGYMQLPRQVLGLDGAPEWPVLMDLLPDPAGMRAVDLGCGVGWVGRWLREQGAASVLGVDVSHNMIERARTLTVDDGVEYQIADLEALDLPAARFDLAFSSLAFHYVRDFDRLVGEIYQSLAPGGRLVFTIEHPIYMAAADKRWLVDEEGRRTWPVNSYSVEGERRMNWFVDGVIKHHRTLATTLNALIGTGFEILRVEEFAPTPEQVRAQPKLAEEVERPMLLMVSARAGRPTVQ